MEGRKAGSILQFLLDIFISFYVHIYSRPMSGLLIMWTFDIVYMSKVIGWQGNGHHSLIWSKCTVRMHMVTTVSVYVSLFAAALHSTERLHLLNYRKEIQDFGYVKFIHFHCVICFPFILFKWGDSVTLLDCSRVTCLISPVVLMLIEMRTRWWEEQWLALNKLLYLLILPFILPLFCRNRTVLYLTVLQCRYFVLFVASPKNK